MHLERASEFTAESGPNGMRTDIMSWRVKQPSIAKLLKNTISSPRYHSNLLFLSLLPISVLALLGLLLRNFSIVQGMFLGLLPGKPSGLARITLRLLVFPFPLLLLLSPLGYFECWFLALRLFRARSKCLRRAVTASHRSEAHFQVFWLFPWWLLQCLGSFNASFFEFRPAGDINHFLDMVGRDVRHCALVCLRLGVVDEECLWITAGLADAFLRDPELHAIMLQNRLALQSSTQ